MASLSAAGIGSGLDVNSLLQQIVEAERGPKESQLDRKEARLQAELTAYGSLKGAVSSFQSSISRLKSSTGFITNQVNIGNKDLMSATATSIAQPGSYSVEVANLAKSHALASIAFEDMDTVIGNGTLRFDFGTTSYDPDTDTYTGFVGNSERPLKSVVIDNSNNTVEGVRDAINEANIGVTASIVNDGSGYRLLLTSDQQGFDNSLRISVDEGGDPANNLDTSGLSQLAFNSDASNLEQTQAAQDAEIFVNGLRILRESNTVTGAIHGVTLNLLEADVGNPTQLSIAKSTGDAQKNIQGFVNAYNDMVKLFNSLTEYNADNGQGGVLLGDNLPRNILSQIRRELSNTINTSGNYNALSRVGITTQRDGTLSLDTDMLNGALQDDPEGVARLFAPGATVSDANIRYLSSTTATPAGTYAISISNLATMGSLSGESVTGPITINSGNSSFSLRVDGINTGTINLTQGSYSDMDILAQEIQNQINAASALETRGLGVTVSWASDHFEITSNTYGSDSSVSVVSANSTLGFSLSATSTAGTDVAGTIGGIPAQGDGQILTGLGSAAGLQLEITGSATGNRGRVEFSRGMAGSLDGILARFLASNGQFSSKTDTLNQQIEDIGEQRETLYKRVAAIEARYRAQFTALDALIGQLNTTSNFLQQQLDSLPEIQVRKK